MVKIASAHQRRQQQENVEERTYIAGPGGGCARGPEVEIVVDSHIFMRPVLRCQGGTLRRPERGNINDQ